MILTAKGNHIYFVTLTVVYWIDIFTRPIYKDLIIDNLRYCQKNKGLEVFSYVIMTNHLHLILRTKNKLLSDILRDFKTFTSKEIYKSIKTNLHESRREWIIPLLEKAGQENRLNKNHQLWQNHNYPIILDTNRKIEIKQNYIHKNPVKQGFVINDFEYLYSSACEESPLIVDPI